MESRLSKVHVMYNLIIDYRYDDVPGYHHDVNNAKMVSSRQIPCSISMSAPLTGNALLFLAFKSDTALAA